MAENTHHNDRRERDGDRSGSGLKSAAKILAVGAAVAGAAAAGYYFYASKNASRNRRVVARWATDFKDDVMRQAQELEHIDREALVGIIDGVSRAYGKMRNMNHADLRDAAEELKHNWRRLTTELQRRDARIGAGTRGSSSRGAKRSASSNGKTRTRTRASSNSRGE